MCNIVHKQNFKKSMLIMTDLKYLIIYLLPILKFDFTV